MQRLLMKNRPRFDGDPEPCTSMLACKFLSFLLCFCCFSQPASHVNVACIWNLHAGESLVIGQIRQRGLLSPRRQEYGSEWRRRSRSRPWNSPGRAGDTLNCAVWWCCSPGSSFHVNFDNWCVEIVEIYIMSRKSLSAEVN